MLDQALLITKNLLGLIHGFMYFNRFHYFHNYGKKINPKTCNYEFLNSLMKKLQIIRFLKTL
jgi:hypothetical protein